ncbi:helix-turn-helix domain-containing protein [Xylophilus sp. ASV27]|uniref:helix-turn-helix domain-containing protein n=1 Tax=Xylophilus sp. ASV27 TaxID=2795129 RepID=UPI0018EDD1CD|nr:helix-turn-helix domain-containing protein [Xylophilus sp. ASV27]
MPATRPLPSTVFATDQAAGEARFEAWRDSISVIFDVAPLAREGLDSFQASVNASHLGNLLIGDLSFGEQQFSRTRARAARDGLDHYLVQWYRSGGFVGQHGDGQDMQVRPGDITVLELDRTLRTFARPSQVLSLIMPRALVDEAFAGPPSGLHGTVLRMETALCGLLSDHLASLHRRLPAIAVADAPAVTQATAQMLAACLRPSRHTQAQAREALHGVTLERIQRHIGRNLGAPLGPDTLCRTFGISRSRLYRLFEQQGGVAHYVQQQRLLRAFHTLANPANQRLRVAEIAARTGFTSEAHFSRAFRAAFGVAPRDARAVGAPAHAAAGSAAPSAEYANWVRGL